MCKKSFENAIKFIVKDNDLCADSAVFDDEGVIYAWSPHQIMRTLEEIDESILKSFSESSREQWLKLMKENFKSVEEQRHIEYALPTVKELKSKIKDAKFGHKRTATVAYNLAEDVRVNARYLLNAITATGVDRCYGNGRAKPILFFGDDTQYFLLPVNTFGELKVGEAVVID